MARHSVHGFFLSFDAKIFLSTVILEGWFRIRDQKRYQRKNQPLAFPTVYRTHYWITIGTRHQKFSPTYISVSQGLLLHSHRAFKSGSPSDSFSWNYKTFSFFFFLFFPSNLQEKKAQWATESETSIIIVWDEVSGDIFHRADWKSFESEGRWGEVEIRSFQVTSENLASCIRDFVMWRWWMTCSACVRKH